ncbi:MAG: FHA domain-containing protein [Planctomycetes bacterium]|nr:FHA domain-containing protein [Planctomycetota bacterium]MBI3835214.1 FHA domain-containing protein [Planctomycetota bacterium]
MATLVVTAGPALGKRFLLAADRLIMVGRHATCTIQIVDPQLSRFHLQLKLTDDGKSHYAIDFESKNGVMVNGNKIQSPTLLGDGDRIEFGDTAMVYDLSDSLSAEDVHRLAKYPAAGYDKTQSE